MENKTSKILCFGDSNTYGYKPNANIHENAEERHDETERWTGRLQQLLGENFSVIEEGLNGRTTNITGNLEGDPEKNGLISFTTIYANNLSLNFLVLQLGTNDLKERFNRTAEDIAAGIEVIIQTAINISNNLGSPIPKIILLSPPLVNETFTKPPYRMKGALEKSGLFAKFYSEVAIRNNCTFLDLATIVTSSTVDGLHLETESHRIIAEALYQIIVSLES